MARSSNNSNSKAPDQQPLVRRGNAKAVAAAKKAKAAEREGEAAAELLTPAELRKAVDTGKRIEVSGYSKGQLVAMLESAYADTPEVEEVKVEVGDDISRGESSTSTLPTSTSTLPKCCQETLAAQSGSEPSDERIPSEEASEEDGGSLTDRNDSGPNTGRSASRASSRGGFTGICFQTSRRCGDSCSACCQQRTFEPPWGQWG